MSDFSKNYLDDTGLGLLWTKIKDNFVAGGGTQATSATYTDAWRQNARKNIGLQSLGSSTRPIYFDGNGNPQQITYTLGSACAKTAGSAEGNVPVLSTGGKLLLSTIPDAIMGQVLYGGTVDASAVATLSTNVKTKLGISSDTVTLTNDTQTYGYKKFEGVYFIMSADSSFASLGLKVGDWLISTGSAWKKIDNTDAVTGVKGDSETGFRTGNVNITKGNIGLGNVENTKLSTWTGSTSITTLGTISTGTWQGSAIGNSYITNTLTGKTYNGLTLTAATTGFTISGGTTSKTLTVSESYTLASACAKSATTATPSSLSNHNTLPTSKAVWDLIDGLDLTEVGGADKYIQAVSQSNGKVSATAVALVTPTVIWADGTTEGPTLKIKDSMGKESSAVAIPSASNTASGIVTTGSQQFAGEKHFTSKLYIDSGVAVIRDADFQDITSQSIVIKKGYAIKLTDSGNNYRNIVKFKSSSDNTLQLGYSGHVTELIGSQVKLNYGSNTGMLLDASGNTTFYGNVTVGTSDAAKNIGCYGGVSAKGVVDLNVAGGGGGTVNSIIVNGSEHTPVEGVITLPDYPTSLPLSSITGATSVQNINALGAGSTTGYLKKTAANTWALGSLVESFGGQTGAITVRGGQTGNGSVNLAMSGKQLQAAIVGLKSAAYTESSAYATAAQGTKADSALQAHQTVTLASGTDNGTLKITTAAGETDNIAVKGLGSAAFVATTALLTALSSNTTNAVSITVGGTTKIIASSTLKTSLGLGAAAYKGVTDNSLETAVTPSDTNLITGRTLFYAGYTKNTGTVTSITLTAGTGISITNSGTAITTSGTRTISLATSGVGAGTYQSVTVDVYGRVTAGSNHDSLAATADSFDLVMGSNEVQFGTIPEATINALGF